MHKSSKRFSVFISSLTNPTLVLLLSVFLCSFLVKKPLPSASLNVSSLSASLNGSSLSLDVKIDLSSQFTFNTKQIFMYVNAVYHNGDTEMVWSDIVERGDSYVYDRTYRNTYLIKGLLKKGCHVELRGCYFPYVGMIRDEVYTRITL